MSRPTRPREEDADEAAEASNQVAVALGLIEQIHPAKKSDDARVDEMDGTDPKQALRERSGLTPAANRGREALPYRIKPVKGTDTKRQVAFMDTLGGFLDDDGPLPGAHHPEVADDEAEPASPPEAAS